MLATEPKGWTVPSLLHNRDYRLLWLGQAASFVGDQFHLVALPWLVLQLSGDPLQLGLIMAAAGIPRALFMLIGGTAADRFSPRTIMLVSDAVRFGLTAFIATAILGGFVELWHVYVLAIVFGTVSGFFSPAANASIPRLLTDRELESGNALMRMAETAASFVGPALAGLLIALFGSTVIGDATTTSLTGIGIAIGVDALTFLVSAVLLIPIRGLQALTRTKARARHELTEGLRFAWNNRAMRWLFALIAAANLFITGPLVVALPVLTEQRLGGAAAFGLILSVFAGGNFVGMALSGSLRTPSPAVMHGAIVAVFAAFGIAVGALAFVSSTWQALPLMLLAGTTNGYITVTFTARLQRMTPAHMLGRVMGLMLLMSFGLRPVSEAAAGWLSRTNVTSVFTFAGVGLLGIALLAAFAPQLRTFDKEIPASGTPAS